MMFFRSYCLLLMLIRRSTASAFFEDARHEFRTDGMQNPGATVNSFFQAQTAAAEARRAAERLVALAKLQNTQEHLQRTASTASTESEFVPAAYEDTKSGFPFPEIAQLQQPEPESDGREGIVNAQSAALQARQAAERLVFLARRQGRLDADLRIARAKGEAKRKLGVVTAVGLAQAEAAQYDVKIREVNNTALNADACPEECNRRGLCVSGGCICDNGFMGAACERRRCPSDCSNQGYCFAGKCYCFGGFGGNDCTELIRVASPTPALEEVKMTMPELPQVTAKKNRLTMPELPLMTAQRSPASFLGAAPVAGTPAQPGESSQAQRDDSSSIIQAVHPKHSIPETVTTKAFPRISWPALPNRGLSTSHFDAEAVETETEKTTTTNGETFVQEKSAVDDLHSIPITASWLSPAARAKTPDDSVEPISSASESAGPVKPIEERSPFDVHTAPEAADLPNLGGSPHLRGQPGEEGEKKTLTSLISRLAKPSGTGHGGSQNDDHPFLMELLKKVSS